MVAPRFVTDLSAFGNLVALVDEHKNQVTYAELAARIDRAGEVLGTRRRLVMVEVDNTIPGVVAYLAALRYGHPVIVSKPGDFRKAGPIVSQFRPSAVVVAGMESFSILHDDDPEVHPELAALFSTSGSTGSAKLVRLSGSNIQANAESIAIYLDIDEREVAPTALPLNYSFGASILASHLLRGGRIVLTQQSVIAPEFAELFYEQQCTSLSGVPYTWELVEKSGLLEGDCKHLKTLTQAGGKMAADRVARLANWARNHGKRLIIMYGQTECTARMSYLPWKYTHTYPESVGIAIPGGSFRLVGEDGQTIAEPNTTGQLVYSGPNVMMGYATERSELVEPPGPPERFTGDLAERNELGLYRIVGRLSRFSKILGLRISLDAIESMAKEAGAVNPVVAGNDKLIAICAEKGSVNAERLEVAISNDCGLPKSSVVVVEVEGGPPRLPNGKVDYQTTLERAEQLLEQRLRGDSLRSEIAEIMGVGALSNADSFANLGGDSLTYVQVSFVIERRLGHLPTGWERMSIAALDDLVVSAEGKTLESERMSKAQWLTIDTDILLRALAILIVVFNHTPPVGVHELPGAMEILFVVAGQNLARFRSPSLFRGDGFGLLSSVLRHYIAPYYVILVAYMVLKRHVDVPSLLLVSTFWRQPLIEPYWFVETFFHLMVTVSVLFAFPMVRRFVSAHPLTWGWVATGILGALHVVEVETGFPLPVFLEWGALFSLGWCVYHARTTKERALVSLSSLAMPWLMTRGYGVAVVLLVMLWIPRIPIGLPAIKTVVGWCGAATFQIYLLHVIVVSALSKIAGLKGTWLYTLIAIFASAAAGVVFNALVARARSFWRQRRRPAIPAL